MNHHEMIRRPELSNTISLQFTNIWVQNQKIILTLVVVPRTTVGGLIYVVGRNQKWGTVLYRR